MLRHGAGSATLREIERGRMLRIVEDEARPLEPNSRCVCEHTPGQHRRQAEVCLAVDRDGRGCWCTEFQRSEDELPAWQVKTRALTSLRAQVEELRATIREAQGRTLAPDEELAVAELFQAFAELSEAVRTLFDE